MSQSNLRRNKPPVITAYPSVTVIELSSTQSITPSYSASMSLSYSQNRVSSPMTSPKPGQWAPTNVSTVLTNDEWLGVFLAIFIVILCSVVYNIRYYKKELNKRKYMTYKQENVVISIFF